MTAGARNSRSPTSLPPVDASSLIAIARRRWLPLVLCLVVSIAGAVSVTRTTPKTYDATARLFVSIPAANDIGEALQGVQLSSQLIASYARVATTRNTAELVAAKLDQRFSADEVRSRVSASPEPDTLLISVRATDTDPASARDIANAAAEALTEVIVDLDDGGGVQARIIDGAALPTSPVRPRPTVDLMVGLLLGLAVGAGLVLLLESLDTTISSATGASEAFRSQVLGTLPRLRRLSQEPLIRLDRASAAGEAYRSLRTSLRFINGGVGRIKTVVVTSPSPGEGKTTVAANLAIAIAQAGERVIIIDGDLRRSRLSTLFGADDGPGLSSIVAGKATLESAMHSWSANLSILAPGPLPPNPSEVLGSQRMADLLDAAATIADVVIIDAPPVLPVTDAAVIAALADAVLLVARWGRTETASAVETRTRLDGVGANVVGVALNGAPPSNGGAYYQKYGNRGVGRTPA